MERFENFYDDINMDDWAEYGDVEGEYKEFEIADASTADWAISKIADERKRKDYFVECANKEIEKLKAQIKEMEKSVNVPHHICLAVWESILNVTKCQRRRLRHRNLSHSQQVRLLRNCQRLNIL